MNSIKLITSKLTPLYPIAVIIVWHYISVSNFIFINLSPNLIRLYQNLNIPVGVSVSLYLCMSLILAAITFFIANRITPKATTWGISFQLALLYGFAYLFFEGIVTIMEGSADGDTHWAGTQAYILWNWRFPIALAFLPVMAACGRWGAYLGLKAQAKAD